MPGDRRGPVLVRKRCRRSGGTARRSTVQAGTIKASNDSGFADKVVDRWAYENGVELDFSRVVRRRTMRWWSASTADCGRSA